MHRRIQHSNFQTFPVLLFVAFIIGCTQERGTYFKHKTALIGENLQIEYEISNFDAAKNKFITKKQEIGIDPKKTALVIVDLWPPKFLDSLTINYVNPLIKELDSLGTKIIYTPSNGTLNKHLEKLSNGIYLYNLEVMDKFILDNGIENLIFVGYDTLYCVLDKPNGIFSFKSRNNNAVRMFVMDKGILSATQEMKETGIELLKKNNVGIIRTDAVSFSPIFPQQTKKNILATTKKGIIPGTHLVVIYKKDSVNSEFKNFENSLNQKGIPYAQVLNNKMTYNGNQLSEYDFIKLLRDKAINNIYYAGYHINNEILWSDYGLISLYIKVRYKEIPMPRFYCLNDMSYVVASDRIAPEIEKATIINHYHGLNNIMSESLLENILETQEENKLLHTN